MCSGRSLFHSMVFRLNGFVLAGLVAFSPAAFSYSYQTFAYSDSNGTYNTYARSISENTVAGYYLDSRSVAHGFTYSNGTISTLDAPNSSSTRAYGIDGGNIVGVYSDDNGAYGFKYDGTTWTTLANSGLPGTTNETVIVPYGISGESIVGSYTLNSVISRGFEKNGSGWTALQYVDGISTRTYAFGVDGGNIVGYYDHEGDHGHHGYLFNGQTWTPLNVPNIPMYDMAVSTNAYDIDGDVIVGSYMDSYSRNHGFVLKDNIYTSFEYPDATDTWVYGVDDGAIVGYYRDRSGAYRGFVATSESVPEPATFLLVGLGLALAGLRNSRRGKSIQ